MLLTYLSMWESLLKVPVQYLNRNWLLKDHLPWQQICTNISIESINLKMAPSFIFCVMHLLFWSGSLLHASWQCASNDFFLLFNRQWDQLRAHWSLYLFQLVTVCHLILPSKLSNWLASIVCQSLSGRWDLAIALKTISFTNGLLWNGLECKLYSV